MITIPLPYHFNFIGDSIIWRCFYENITSLPKQYFRCTMSSEDWKWNKPDGGRQIPYDLYVEPNQQNKQASKIEPERWKERTNWQ